MGINIDNFVLQIWRLVDKRISKLYNDGFLTFKQRGYFSLHPSVWVFNVLAIYEAQECIRVEIKQYVHVYTFNGLISV